MLKAAAIHRQFLSRYCIQNDQEGCPMASKKRFFLFLVFCLTLFFVSQALALNTVERNGKKYIADWDNPTVYHFAGEHSENFPNVVKYYVREDGEVPTGWFQDNNGQWRYANSEGFISTPWSRLLKGTLSFNIPSYVNSIQMEDLSGLTKDSVLQVETGSYGEQFAKGNALPYDNGFSRVIGTNITNENEKINWIISQYVTPDMSDIEKIRVLHDWITNNTRYDPDYGAQNGNPRNLLLDQLGICGEHSEAFVKLLKAANFEVMEISSDAIDHAWNLVKIDGKWYHIDTTWDDPGDGSEGSELTGYENYDYFIKEDNEIGTNHTLYDSSALSFLIANNPGGFKFVDNKMRYYDEGSGLPVSGWKTIIDTDYSWDKTHLTLLVKQEYERYHMLADGEVQVGWQEIDGNRYYFQPDGVMAKGTCVIDNITYYFDQSGRLQSGKIWENNRLIQLDNNGRLQTGFRNENGQQFLFTNLSNTGAGQVSIEGSQYQLDGLNTIVKGLFQGNNEIRYYNQEGKQTDGWVNTDRGWMYLWGTHPLIGGYYTLDKDGFTGYFSFSEDGILNDYYNMNWEQVTSNLFPSASTHVHIQEIIPGKDATLTESGLTRGIRCSVCGQILSPQTEIPPFSSVACFVDRCYDKILERKSDEGGLINWTEKLESQYLAASNIISGFVNSPEFESKNLSHEDQVELLYQTMLNRASDPAGKAYWVSYLDAGLSINTVAAGFVGAQEFLALCADYGIDNGSYILEARDQNAQITGFVRRCYQEALDRNPDTQGLNYWCQELLSHTQTPQQVAHGFVTSAEMINKQLSNGDYIRTLYHLYFGREPDAGGFEYWLSQLENGMPRENLEYGFANSAEFSAIVADYGL